MPAYDTIAASGHKMKTILCIAGPTASGKSARAVGEALKRGGEIISVDSRQVYRRCDIGTEKTTVEEQCGVPHYLIDIREPKDAYSAGDFVQDAEKLIDDISARGKLPILVGGTHFYFHALLIGLPNEVMPDLILREKLEKMSTEELYADIIARDPRRATELDPKNRRRLVRAIEIIESKGAVSERIPKKHNYAVEWVVINPPQEELRPKMDLRLKIAFDRGLIDEVERIREEVGDVRLNELGLEYKIVGEYLQGERTKESLLPTLSSRLWQYARRQKAWLRKLKDEQII